MEEARSKIEIGPVKGLVLGDHATVNINDANPQWIDWDAKLTIAHNLLLDSFKLGDSSAANFPYVIQPIQNVYDKALLALHEASTETGRAKSGLLIFGESNSGKTRLALETLRLALPNWPVLRWRPDYRTNNVPPEKFLSGKFLVLFIDDLQDYVPTLITGTDSGNLAFDSPATTLRTLLEILLQAAEKVVVIATCRTEDKLRVQAVLTWLFDKLVDVTVPSFSTRENDNEAELVVTKFQERGTINRNDWDGTLGSLVLGLSTKNSQYLALTQAHASAATILQAMK